MAVISSIGNINSDFTPAADSRVPVKNLGQEDFIKILVAQLTTQDPLNPQKDTEFIAQMAQFSTLENNKLMQAELQSLKSDQEFIKANNMIGRQVELIDEEDNNIEGVVSSVEMISGKAHLVIDEKPYPMEQVIRVWQNGAAVMAPIQAHKAPVANNPIPTQAH